MYINKTSRRLIFFNAAFLAVILLFVAKKLFHTGGLFNVVFPFYVFSASVIVESLRYLKNKKKLKKIFKIIENNICLVNRLEPCRDEIEMMEEMPGTDRI